jgi:EAL domain
MLKALKGMFAGADKPVEDDDERDASGKPKVTLARALRRGWLEVWYQPKVSLQTGHMIGAEGLIRARHPELGVLGPGAFLPGASEREMLQMTERVIATALRDWNDCAALGMPAIHLSVNVPASAFVELPIAQLVREERPKSDQWPGLILEITEDQIVNDLKMANEVANELREQRCSLAIDDFGAGYSSLWRSPRASTSAARCRRRRPPRCSSARSCRDGARSPLLFPTAHGRPQAEAVARAHEQAARPAQDLRSVAERVPAVPPAAPPAPGVPALRHVRRP